MLRGQDKKQKNKKLFSLYLNWTFLKFAYCASTYQLITRNGNAEISLRHQNSSFLIISFQHFVIFPTKPADVSSLIVCAVSN